jgi:hypothetical protein
MTQKSVTPVAPPVEKTVTSRVQVSLYTKQYKWIVYSMWITTTWQLISPEVVVKGLRSAEYSKKLMKLMLTHCGMTVRSLGMLRVGVRKMKALPVKMETVTLVGLKVDRIRLAVCMKCTKFVV